MRGVKRVVFENGLTLLMEKRLYSGDVVILVATKSGSMHESSDDAGITHFVEHMLFRSNKQRSAREITEELESAGAEINAFTDHAFMTFYADTLPGEISKTLDIVYEAAVNDSYDKDEFQKEKSDVLSEIKTCIEHPAAYLYYNLFLPTLFQGTCLEKTVDGSVKTVSKMTPRRLAEYKKEILSPNRPMAVVVVGKYDEEEVIAEVGKTFGSLPKGTHRPFAELSYCNKKTRKIEKREEIEQAYLNMGFQVPCHPHKDMFKLILLQGILTGGMSSRLFKELRDKRGVGYAVSSELESFDGVGSFCFEVSVYDPDRLEEVEEVIRTEMKDLRTNLVGTQELEKAKNLVVKAYNKGISQPEGRAVRLMVQEFQKIPYDFRKFEYYVRRLSARSLKEAARKYFTDDYTLCALVPK